MPKVSEHFTTRFLSGHDLPGDVTVTITSYQTEEVNEMRGGKPTDRKVNADVIYFRELHKGMMLNKTNAHDIMRLLGIDEMTEWVGHQITIFPESMMVGGKPQRAVRVRPKLPPTIKLRVLGDKGKAKLLERLLQLGKTFDALIVSVKHRDATAHSAMLGRELQDIPETCIPAIMACFKEWDEQRRNPAPAYTGPDANGDLSEDEIPF